MDRIPLDLKNIKEKDYIIVPTVQALSDVERIQWDSDVINGNKKVILIGKDNPIRIKGSTTYR